MSLGPYQHSTTQTEGSQIAEQATSFKVWTFQANAAITAGQLVESIASAGTTMNVTPAANNSALTVGVAVATAASGTHVPVLIEGLVRGITASGSISAGNRLVSAGSGQFKAYSSATNNPDQIVGQALQDVTNANTFLAYIDVV